MKICIYLYNACRTALTAGARVETVGGNIPLEIVPVEYVPEVINNRGKSATGILPVENLPVGIL